MNNETHDQIVHFAVLEKLGWKDIRKADNPDIWIGVPPDQQPYDYVTYTTIPRLSIELLQELAHTYGLLQELQELAHTFRTGMIHDKSCVIEAELILDAIDNDDDESLDRKYKF